MRTAGIRSGAAYVGPRFRCYSTPKTGDDGTRGQGPAPGTPAKGALPPWTPGFFGKGEGGGNLAQLTRRGSVLLIAGKSASRQVGNAAGFCESPKPSRRFVVS